MEKIPEDIVAKVLQDFPGSEALEILQLLKELQNASHFGDRTLRCIVFYANGSFDRFARAVEMARADWRDLIANVEYDGLLRLRDLTKPFPIAHGNSQ